MDDNNILQKNITSDELYDASDFSQVFDNVFPVVYKKENYVAQDNILIRSKQDELTLLEAKLLRFIISQILKNDTDLRTYSVKISELSELLKISKQNLYISADHLSTELMRKIITIEDKSSKRNSGNTKYKKFHWVDMVEYKDGIITLRLSEELKPYVISLGQYFTTYDLQDVLYLSSNNAIRLFELLSSYKNLKFNDVPSLANVDIPYEKGEIVLSVEFLREYFNAQNKYPNTGDFIIKIIEKNVKEINTKTFLSVSYRIYKNKKQITYVIFKIGDS